MHPEIIKLLCAAFRQPHVGVMVATCGLKGVWEIALKREGLEGVSVIGNGHWSEWLVQTGPLKSALMGRITSVGLRAFAFGDSLLDLKMLEKASDAFILVGKTYERSRTMDEALPKSLSNGISARQTNLPKGESPRVDTKRLPEFHLYPKNISWILG